MIERRWRRAGSEAAARRIRRAVPALALALLAAPAAGQQQQPAPAQGGWQTGVETVAPRAPQGETVVPRVRPATPAPVVPQPTVQPAAPSVPWPSLDADLGAAPGPIPVQLSAVLTDDGQRIDQGLQWHVFQDVQTADGRATKLIASSRDAAPQLKLPVGDYLVTASFGRAHLSRRIAVRPGAGSSEQFVLNAGGLRVTALQASGEAAPPGSVAYDIFSDERDQAGNRAKLVSGVKPGLIIRLNSGAYHIVSTYGDANAQVLADVTVEPGKLTEATITHEIARVTLKLVTRAGGEALADTLWTIATPQGVVVKESAGALPTHIIAPGTYAAIARSGGRTFRREFEIGIGQSLQVEVLVR